MTHDEFESIAALDALGAASAEEESTLRQHMETCDSCRRARDEFVEAASLMARDLDPVAAPAEARQRSMENAENVEVGETTLAEAHRRFAIRPWWLVTAALLFLFLWGWRELGIRAAREKIASRDAEINRLTLENARLGEQVARLNYETSVLAPPGTRSFTVSAPPVVSARVSINPQGQALLTVASAPPNTYKLWVTQVNQPKPQNVATFDVAPAGQKTIPIQHLPPVKSIKAFSLTTR
ncbi:MAG TPA: hypothetical protein VII12_07995 [Thermoanaerobaculia bacterium]